jgi:uncharacterized protein YheU (UPF0270 family)
MQKINGLEIPYERLSADVLRGIIENFVLREGTDYGSHEYSLDDKVTAVRRQLERRDAVVVFNPDDESCSIVPCR